MWEEDIDYRKEAGYPSDGIENIEWNRVTADFELETDSLAVDAFPVEHTIGTYWFKLQGKSTNSTVVQSSDTAKFDGLSEFAANVDVLLIICGSMPGGDVPDDGRFANSTHNNILKISAGC